ncbi:Auxin-responsive protein SAUR19 [Linum perenne]
MKSGKQILSLPNFLAKRTTSSASASVPKGCFSVYVGESQKKRFVVPVWYLSQPSFIQLLRKAEEEFGFCHPMGGLTLPCREDVFIDIISMLRCKMPSSSLTQI